MQAPRIRGVWLFGCVMRKTHLHPIDMRCFTKNSDKMTLMYIIQETLLMMGFTFLVGIAFAYLLKAMTLFFSLFIGGNLPSMLHKNYVWRRAYRINVVHSYNYIRSFSRDKEFIKMLSQNSDKEVAATLTMDNLAEYHFGNTDAGSKQDSEMNRLYEFHYGKI